MILLYLAILPILDISQKEEALAKAAAKYFYFEGIDSPDKAKQEIKNIDIELGKIGKKAIDGNLSPSEFKKLNEQLSEKKKMLKLISSGKTGDVSETVQLGLQSIPTNIVNAMAKTSDAIYETLVDPVLKWLGLGSTESKHCDRCKGE